VGRAPSGGGGPQALQERGGWAEPETVRAFGRFADIVGRERVIAGADCGFASFAATWSAHGVVAHSIDISTCYP